MYVYFWALYSVPWIYVSVFMPVPRCFDYYGLIVELMLGSLIPPTLFFFLSITGPFVVPYKFLKYLF